jgi:RHS repeat-associated protein
MLVLRFPVERQSRLLHPFSAILLLAFALGVSVSPLRSAAISASKTAPTSAIRKTSPDAVPSGLEESRLEEPLIPTRSVSVEETADLRSALASFRDRRRIDDLSALEDFVASHPHSGWNVALLTNLGLLDYHYGLFSKAFRDWTEAWNTGKGIKTGPGKALVDRAFGELIRMHARLGHADQIAALLKELVGRPIAGSATEYVDGAKEGLWTMRNNPGVAYLCGPMALKNLLLALGATHDKVFFLDEYRSGPHGVTLDQVSRLADQAGLAHEIVFRQSAESVPVPSIVHWKVNHYAAIVGRVGDEFHIEDPTFGNDLWVTKEALDSEGSGYYLVPKPQILAQGRPVGIQEASHVFGMGQTGGNDENSTTPDDKNASSCGGSGAPGAESATTPGSSSGPPLCGYNIKEMVVSLNLTDTPVGYAPPKGPPVFVTVSYNQREASQPGVFDFFNISPKWTLNWLGYIQDYPQQVGIDVTRYVRGGGEAVYSDYNSQTGAFDPDPDDASTLVLVSTNPVRYENRFPDGSVEVYAHSDGEPDVRRVFLSQVIDPYGNTVTLNYDTQLRLKSMTDAIGRNTTFSYGLSAYPLLVTEITDPFGRFAKLAYDSMGRLEQITDVIGLTSQFHYNASSLIDTLTTPYGVTSFSFGDNGNERFLNATDPLGHTERVEYIQGVSVIPFSDPASTVPAGIIAPFNVYLNYRDTYYWDGHAYAVASGDYTKARIRHWTHLASNNNLTANSIESIKYPFENRIWMNYPGQPDCCLGTAVSGTYNSPSLIGRVLDDGTTQLTQNTYNLRGHLTDTVDPNGRETKYIYADDGIDLLQVLQRTSGSGFSQIAAFTYNAAHLPLTSTDASGQISHFTYNGAGQLTSRTNALGQVTRYEYDSQGRLTSIINANGKTAASFIYDAVDRVASSTDSEGYTINYQYDNANRMTRETYPDGTARQFVWNNLDLTSVTDRQGKTTQYTYDAARNLIDIADPLGQHTKLSYYENRTLKSLTDPNGNATTWSIDVQNRVTGKQYADGSKITNTYEATTSRLHAVADAMNQVKQYAYNLDDTIATISYIHAVNPTPDVRFNYDPYFPRVVSMEDGTGNTEYTYGPFGVPGALQLAQETSSFLNQSVNYDYDPLGRLDQRRIGSHSETVVYDSIGRMTSDVNQLGVFAMTYLGETGQLTSRTLRGLPLIGSHYEYQPNRNDRRLKAILNTSGTPSFRYETTPENLISKVTESRAGVVPIPAQSWTYQYDSDYRLIGADSSQGQLYSYDYDPDDNVTAASGPGYQLNGAYNNLDQLTEAGSSTFAYDANGNLLSDGVRSFSWDADNRLIQTATTANGVSHTTGFVYDGLGRRVAINGAEGETRYVWCGEIMCASERVDNSIFRLYFAEGEALPISQEALYYSQDNLGSIRGVVGFQGGPVTGSYDFDPYGNSTYTEGDASTDFRFAAMFYEPNSALYLTLHRLYDPRTGRWLSRDPVGALGTLNITSDQSESVEAEERTLWAPLSSRSTANVLFPGKGQLTNPNLYAYVGRNPVSYVDPLGLWTINIGISGTINIPFYGPVGIGGGGFYGIAYDGTTFATYKGAGVGVGAGAGGSLGIEFGASNADSVCDLVGPFGWISASGGEGLIIGGEGYTGSGSKGQSIYGGNFFIGGGGGTPVSGTAGVTYTWVQPW